MDIDLATPGLERIVGSEPPLDQIAHGLTFGEGPVWDHRQQRFSVDRHHRRHHLAVDAGRRQAGPDSSLDVMPTA